MAKTAILGLTAIAVVFAQASPNEVERAAQLQASMNSKMALQCRDAVTAGTEAVDLWRKHPEKAGELADTLDSLGQALITCQEPDLAEKPITESLQIRLRKFGRDSAQVAESESNLAAVFFFRKRYAEALHHLRAALEIQEGHRDTLLPALAQTQSSLSVVLLRLDQVDEAEAMARAALKTRETIRDRSPQHDALPVASSLHNLAGILLARHDFVEAARALETAASIREQELRNDHPLIADTLAALVTAYLGLNDCNNAVRVARREHDIEEHILHLNLAGGTQKDKLALLNSLKGELAILISLRNRCHGAVPELNAFAAESTVNRKGIVLDSLVQDYAFEKSRHDAGVQEQWRQRNRVLGELARAELEPRKSRDEERLHSLREQLATLERSASHRDAGVDLILGPVTIRAVRAALPRGAVLIQFVSYYPKVEQDNRGGWAKAPVYAANLIYPDRDPEWVELGLTETINSRVAELLPIMNRPNESSDAVTRELYDLIFTKLRPLIAGYTKLVLVPDDRLSLLPFAVLRDPSGRYLLRDYEIAYVNAARDLLRFSRTQPSRERSVVFAGLKYSRNAHECRLEDRTCWAYLPGSLKEGQVVAQLLDAELIAGNRGTEAQAKAVRHPAVLHLATHAYLSRRAGVANEAEPTMLSEIMARSGLILAGANDPPTLEGDGRLTALEASALDLLGTQLVTLSACESALGSTGDDGEGVYGLRRALFAAGARAVVMNVWEVREDSATLLMRYFYSALISGSSKSAALRAAQLKLLKQKEFSHPHFWAGFVVSGDPAPISLR